MSVVDEEGQRSQGGTEYILIEGVSILLSIYIGTEGVYRQYRRFSHLLRSRRSFQVLAHTMGFRSPFCLVLLSILCITLPWFPAMGANPHTFVPPLD